MNTKGFRAKTAQVATMPQSRQQHGQLRINFLQANPDSQQLEQPSQLKPPSGIRRDGMVQAFGLEVIPRRYGHHAVCVKLICHQDVSVTGWILSKQRTQPPSKTGSTRKDNAMLASQSFVQQVIPTCVQAILLSKSLGSSNPILRIASELVPQSRQWID